ncbi:hypothetical protein QBC44DRAFT_392989 [Cladorrhinum sp. PSN332]|nr:hypothetical protein QBC44DRAFT_392989 [Cladorrhinum sp. PSN332]
MPRTLTAKKSTDNGQAATLSRENLEGFKVATRKEAAHKRGRSTPSPSPDFHDYQSDASFLPENHPDLPRVQCVQQTKSEQEAYEAKWGAPAVIHEPADLPLQEVKDDDDHDDDLQLKAKEQLEAAVRGELPPGTKAIFPQDQAILDDWTAPRLPQEEYHGVVDEIVANQVAKHQGPQLPDVRPEIPRQQESDEPPEKPNPQFPVNFPAYHCTQNMNEIAAYLANASYVVSLGGPPLGDLKYGIIVVPAGEERLLFGPSPEFSFNQEFIDSVEDANRDYGRALRMHNPSLDSAEFVRHRFEDGFRSVSPHEQRNVDHRDDAQMETKGNLKPAEEGDKTDDHDTEVEDEPAHELADNTTTLQSRPRGRAREDPVPEEDKISIEEGIVVGPTITGKAARRGTAVRGSSSKPQGVMKGKRKQRASESLEVGASSHPATRRTSGRKK